MNTKKKPGQVRDAIIASLREANTSLSVASIHRAVTDKIGTTAASSIRSYLRLNAGEIFIREEKGEYSIKSPTTSGYKSRDLFESQGVPIEFAHGKSTVYNSDCFDWLEARRACSIHAIVTDPPYGLVEFSSKEKAKLRSGKGGVWRLPPSFDGHQRSPLPRFTTLTENDLENIKDFFYMWACRIHRVLVPGANVAVACNPLVSHLVSMSLARGGLERRGELIRLVMTMRGGDRPKAAHEEFSDVSVMPRSMWEPWVLFRKPVEGRVQDNLRKWGTGGFRRISAEKPFGDVIQSAPTRASERELAPHPSLKPQAFLRQIVRGSLPLGEGIVLDPFAGSGSTLAAANAVGYESIGIEKDPDYFEASRSAIPKLEALEID